MSSRLSAVLFTFACAVIACAGGVPDDGGKNDGTGTGTGMGSGPGSGPGDGPGTGGSLTATQFVAELDKKFCDAAHMCKANFPTDAGVTFEEAFGANAAACVAEAAMYSQGLEAAVSSGKVKFNAADAAKCIAGITIPACTSFWTEGPDGPPECETALVGTVADGGACTIDFECSNANAYCDETTKKCTPDATGSRTVPAEDMLLHLHATMRK